MKVIIRVTNLFGIEKEQRTFEICGVKVGGRPGETPTVLIGTIFYRGHKIVEDDKKGAFDHEKAEELLNLQDELAEKTGNPCMVDVVGSSPEALQRYLDFVSSSTDAPILIDGINAANNVSGLEYAEESGLIDRVVYNSLTPFYSQVEIKKIREVRLESAVLLAMNTKDFTARGRVTAIDDLIDVTSAAGIRKPVIDTCVLDLPTLGQACRALFELKKKYGLPVGCGAHNAVDLWKRLKNKFGKRAMKPCTASTNVIAAAVGADFVLYGPIEIADYIFPAVGMVDVAYGQVLMEKGQRLERTHPRFKLGK